MSVAADTNPLSVIQAHTNKLVSALVRRTTMRRLLKKLHAVAQPTPIDAVKSTFKISAKVGPQTEAITPERFLSVEFKAPIVGMGHYRASVTDQNFADGVADFLARNMQRCLEHAAANALSHALNDIDEHRFVLGMAGEFIEGDE